MSPVPTTELCKKAWLVSVNRLMTSVSLGDAGPTMISQRMVMMDGLKSKETLIAESIRSSM